MRWQKRGRQSAIEGFHRFASPKQRRPLRILTDLVAPQSHLYTGLAVVVTDGCSLLLWWTASQSVPLRCCSHKLVEGGLMNTPGFSVLRRPISTPLFLRVAGFFRWSRSLWDGDVSLSTRLVLLSLWRTVFLLCAHSTRYGGLGACHEPSSVKKSALRGSIGVSLCLSMLQLDRRVDLISKSTAWCIS